MDLSPGSLRALPYAASIARHYGGKIIFAHIVPAEDYDPLDRASLNEIGKLQAGAEAGLLASLGASVSDIPYGMLLERGSIRSRLIDAAQKSDIDLIVLGTHGWQRIKKVLKGSTAEEIAHLAARPVLTVGPNVSCPPEFRRILYETDLSPAAARALPYALSVAHLYRGSILLLHVNEWGSEEAPGEAVMNTGRFVREQLLRYGAHGR